MPVDPDLELGTYLATLRGVAGLLPDQAITATSKPTDEQVVGMVDTATTWLQGRVGDLAAYPPAIVAELGLTARRLVEMGAAGLASNAAHPDRAGRGATSLGDWYWEQFLKGVDEVLESLQKRTADAGGAVVEVPVGDVPAYNFPPPTFYRDTGF